MKKNLLVLLCASVMLSGCGTFALGTAIPQTPKTASEQQLDSLECKDKARLAASSTERQVGAFLLGMTIIGAPAAFELDKSKQREVYKSCMEGKGYKVIPPSDGQTAGSGGFAPAVTTNAKIDLPAGWDKKELSPTMVASSATMYQMNKTIDSGLLVFSTKKESITDVDAYIKSRVSIQVSNLDNASIKDILQTTINGLPAWQAEVTGNLKAGQKQSITYLQTYFDGSDEVVLINIWTSSNNFPNQKDGFLRILNSISGLTPAVKTSITPSPIKVTIEKGGDVKTQNSMNRMNELNDLLKKGLINQQDYNAKKSEILKAM